MSLLPFEYAERSGDAPISVGEVNRRIVQALSEGLPGSIRVRGEISNLTVRNGHRFFSLRDESASLDAVMWSSQARSSRHRPENGDAVVVTGRVSHWPRGGRTRLEVRQIDLDGEGGLRAAFLKRCAVLRERGWFDEIHKQPLPAWPRRIAVVTSAQGAALTDVIATARTRFPATALTVVDVRVQGTSAAAEVAAAVSGLDATAAASGIDAIIVTRGGGSSEDLDAFNAMEVAEAVFHAATPIVAAIGHESDTTIVELVADLRASTPTQAVMRVLPDREDVHARFDSLAQRMTQIITRDQRRAEEQLMRLTQRLGHGGNVVLERHRNRSETLAQRLQASRPDRLLERRRVQISSLAARLGAAGVRDLQVRNRLPAVAERLHRTVLDHIERGRVRLTGLERALLAVDPLAVLQRGYSITTDASGRTIRRADDCVAGDLLETRLADGTLRSRIESRST